MGFPLAPDSSALVRFQKQIDHIVMELNVLKELQALQTGARHSPPHLRNMLQNFLNYAFFGENVTTIIQFWPSPNYPPSPRFEP